MAKNEKTFVVDGAARLAKFLDAFTAFNLFRERLNLIPNNEAWIDRYALGCASGSIAVYLISFALYRTPGYVAFTGYSAIALLAIWRIYEIFVYQLRILFVDQHLEGAAYKVKDHLRLGVLAASNYIETVFWFATLYSIIAHLEWITVPSPAVFSILRESVGLMVASAGEFRLQTSWLAWLTVTLHALIGLFMSLVIVARMVALLPRPATKSENEPSSQ